MRGLAGGLLVSACLLLAPGGAAAQDASASPAPAGGAAAGAPGFVIVSGLARDDLLNIRASASAGGRVLGRLSNGSILRRFNCEPVNGYDWCRVEALGDETMSGWTPARYLAPTAVEPGVAVKTEPSPIPGAEQPAADAAAAAQSVGAVPTPEMAGAPGATLIGEPAAQSPADGSGTVAESAAAQAETAAGETASSPAGEAPDVRAADEPPAAAASQDTGASAPEAASAASPAARSPDAVPAAGAQARATSRSAQRARPGAATAEVAPPAQERWADDPSAAEDASAQASPAAVADAPLLSPAVIVLCLFPAVLMAFMAAAASFGSFTFASPFDEPQPSA